MVDLVPGGQMSQLTQDRKKRSQPLRAPRIFYHEGPALMTAQFSVDYATPSALVCSYSISYSTMTDTRRVPATSSRLMLILLLSPPGDIYQKWKAKE